MDDKVIDTILKVENLTKKYPGVIALDNISLEIKRGRVHSFVGENGAGKSTLIKLITGAIEKTSGKIYYNDKELKDNSPIYSLNLGIIAVYQELNMIPSLSIAENIFYGNEKMKGLVLDKKYMLEKSKELLKDLGFNLPVETNIKDIGIGNQQLVEIGKALVRDVELLTLDEPTASLTENEIVNLFAIIEKLKNRGVTIIYISHRLEEVLDISDDITVLRDGEIVCTKPVSEVNEESLINLMVGRKIIRSKKDEDKIISPEKILELKNLNTKFVKDISLSLFKGEILGIAGLIGSGRTELAQAIFGVDKIISGEIFINEELKKISSPKDAIENSLSFITEDRKTLGLLLDLSVLENTSYVALANFSQVGIINKNKEKKYVEDILEKLQVKYSYLGEKVINLSGGNQQKIVIGKWLLSDASIFIFDEPTRGIDVKAKEEIYNILRDLTKEGKSVIVISSEMEEVINISNRILVMSNGRIVSEYDPLEITPREIFIDSASLLKEEKDG